MGKFVASDRQQLALSIVDQCLYSGSNLGFLVVVSQVSTGTSFGRFVLLYATYILTVGLVRSLVTDPLLLTDRDKSPLAASVLGGILAASLTVGAVGSLVLMITYAATGSSSALAFAFAMPILAAQDTVRAIGFYHHEAHVVLSIDLIWVVVQFGLTGWLLISGRPQDWALVLCWLFGAACSSVAGLVWLRLVPSRGGMYWVRSNRSRSLGMAGDFMLGQGSEQLALVAIAVVLGPIQVAAVRIVQVAFGPANVLVQGMYGWAMPRLAARDGPQRQLLGIRLAVSLGTIAMCVTALLLLAPPPLLTDVFGSPWSAVSVALICVSGAHRAGAAYSTGLSWLVRSIGRTSDLAIARGASGLVSVVSCPALASLLGAEGAVAGFLLGVSVFTVWCHMLMRTTN